MFDNSKLKKIGSVWLFVLPAFIPLMVFWIYPILKSLYISFTDWDYMSPTYNFVFLDNFIKLFKDSRFYEALGTTVWFSIGTLFPTIAGGLLLALLLRKTFRGSGFFKFILFSPWITPTVAVSIVWTWIFMNFEFMTIDTPLPPCMPFPRALTGFPVSSTAKVMYCRMLDAMLSKGQEDENGILFVCFPVTAIAAVLSRSPMTVKRSLNELEIAGLIMRVRQGVGEPNRIYVLMPGKEDAALA